MNLVSFYLSLPITSVGQPSTAVAQSLLWLERVGSVTLELIDHPGVHANSEHRRLAQNWHSQRLSPKRSLGKQTSPLRRPIEARLDGLRSRRGRKGVACFPSFVHCFVKKAKE